MLIHYGGIMKNCENCNAQIESSETKCPYCGYINYEGAYANYINKLDDIKDDLQDLENLPKQEFNNELKQQGKRSIKNIFKIIMTIVVVLAAFYVASSILVGHDSYESVDPKEQLLWQQNVFPTLDQWYEEKDYDAIVEYEIELFSDDSNLFTLFNWQHYEFIDLYAHYYFYKENLDYRNTGEKLDEYAYLDILYGLIKYKVYTTEDDFSIEQQEILDEYYIEMQHFIQAELEINDNELAYVFENALDENKRIDFEYIEEVIENKMR